MLGPRALVLSPVIPSPANDGFKIAVQSDLASLGLLCASIDLVQFDTSATVSGCSQIDSPAGKTVTLQVKGGGRMIRSIRALRSGIPAAIERYYTTEAKSVVANLIRNNPYDIIISEDVSLAGLLPPRPNIVQRSRLVIRSHNVMHDAAMAYVHGGQLKRMMGQEELRRWRTFEAARLASVHENWAIGPHDCNRFRALFPDVNTHLVPISLDRDRYLPLVDAPRTEDSFGYIGTLDLRRSDSLRELFQSTWPEILKHRAEASLAIAGRNSSGVVIGGRNVKQLGNALDDREILGACRFFINPQRVGGGITLKSLIAMLSGCVLISAPAGMAGLDAIPDVHYLDLDTFVSRVRRGWWPSPGDQSTMGGIASELVRNSFSQEKVCAALSERLSPIKA